MVETGQVLNPVSDAAAFAVVIPAYNEAATIRGVAARALRHAPRVIVVDDGSLDGTADALEDLPVTVLRHVRNLGKASSLWRGMETALRDGATAVITLDGDGQHAPEDIPRLVAAHRRHPRTIVIGSRLHERHRIPPLRYYANRAANFWIGWAAGQSIPDSQSGFRLYPAEVLRSVQVAHGRTAGFVFESEILIEAGRGGMPSVPVPIAAIYGDHLRASHFRRVTDIALIVRMVAWKLLARGMDLPGLIRSLRQSDRPKRDGAFSQC
jgi:glycosyltransferase involved in cell wall biosynthesis